MKNIGIQYMRVGAMLFIVLYHCICYYGFWPKLFPEASAYPCLIQISYVCLIVLKLFFFLSGLLYGRQLAAGRYSSRRKLMANKARRLLYPYLLWGVLAIMLFPDHSDYKMSNLIDDPQHLWFLQILFLLFVAVILLGQWARHPRLLACFLIMSIVLRWYTQRNPLSSPGLHCIQICIIYMPVFIWGIYCGVLNLEKMVDRWKPSLFYSLFTILTIAQTVLGFNIAWGENGLRNDIVSGLWIFGLYVIVNSKLHLPDSRWISRMDSHSMNIYIIHHILIWAALLYIPGVVGLMNKLYLWGPLILFIIILPLSWCLSVVLERYRLTSMLFHPSELRRKRLS